MSMVHLKRETARAFVLQPPELCRRSLEMRESNSTWRSKRSATLPRVTRFVLTMRKRLPTVFWSKSSPQEALLAHLFYTNKSMTAFAQFQTVIHCLVLAKEPSLSATSANHVSASVPYWSTCVSSQEWLDTGSRKDCSNNWPLSPIAGPVETNIMLLCLRRSSEICHVAIKFCPCASAHGQWRHADWCAEHYEPFNFQFFFSVSDHTIDNVLALITDNDNTKREFARWLDKPLLVSIGTGSALLSGTFLATKMTSLVKYMCWRGSFCIRSWWPNSNNGHYSR